MRSDSIGRLVEVVLAAWMIIAVTTWLGVVFQIPAPVLGGYLWLALAVAGLGSLALGLFKKLGSGK